MTADLPLLDSPLVGEAFAPAAADTADRAVLVLGIGNLLMGDEGVGIHVLRQLERAEVSPGVRLLDGGTGGVNLLREFDGVRELILVDATRDGQAAGTITLLRPTAVAELPRGLGAHDFGLKDLFAAAALLGKLPRLHLYTVSVEEIRPMDTTLSPAVAAAVPAVVESVHLRATALALVHDFLPDAR